MSNIGKINLHDQSGSRYQCVYLGYLVWWKSITTLSVSKEDEPDNRVLECATEAKAQYIISGDEHHLQPLEEYQGIKILSPAKFVELMKPGQE